MHAPPLLLDQVIVQAAPLGGGVAPMLTTPAHEQGEVDLAPAREQAKSYRYWNYVAITRIMDRCSQPRPEVGTVVGRGAVAGRQYLDGRSLEWVRQSYGLCQSMDEDFAPLAESHPFLRLLADVNPEDTWSEFIAETVMFLRLTGKFCWLVIPNSFGLPAQMTVLPSHWVAPKYSKSGELISWVITPDDPTKRRELPPDWIVCGRYKNPLSKRDGMSPLFASPRWTDNVEAIEKSRGLSFKNAVWPDLLIYLEGDKYNDASEDLIDRVRNRFMRRMAGVERGGIGGPLFIPPGSKAEKWNTSPREMDFGTSSDQARDNSLALHGTPPVIAGVTSDYTRATADAGTVVFCSITVNPTLRLIAGVLQEHVAVRFDERIVVWYRDVTPADAAFELQQDEADFKMGAIDPDEVRMKRGREPKGTPWYGTGYLPTGVMPLDQELVEMPEEEPEPPEPEAEDDEDEDEEDE